MFFVKFLGGKMQNCRKNFKNTVEKNYFGSRNYFQVIFFVTFRVKSFVDCEHPNARIYLNVLFLEDHRSTETTCN